MTVLWVAGGTGTFGHAYVPVALKSGLFDKIVIFSRDEDKQFRMRGLLGDDARLRWHIGDVRDKERLLLSLKGVDYVVFASALKHVPSGEHNPEEHIKTNILGAMNVARAAIDCGVSKMLGISTDKAVEPINLYGASKMCMEKLLMAFNVMAPGQTAFSCVRYGNVLGSRGSFIETLKKLASEGAKTFPLRSAESTRFWMEPEQAAVFVLDRLLEMDGGEIFVPKLPSSTALSFARQYLPNAEPEIVGIPRGEKIHEVLISQEEWSFTEDRGDHYCILPNGPRRKVKPGMMYASNMNPHNPGRCEDCGMETPPGRFRCEMCALRTCPTAHPEDEMKHRNERDIQDDSRDERGALPLAEPQFVPGGRKPLRDSVKGVRSRHRPGEAVQDQQDAAHKGAEGVPFHLIPKEKLKQADLPFRG